MLVVSCDFQNGAITNQESDPSSHSSVIIYIYQCNTYRQHDSAKPRASRIDGSLQQRAPLRIGIEWYRWKKIKTKKERNGDEEVRNSKLKIRINIFLRKYLRRFSTSHSAKQFNLLRTVKLLMGVMLKVVIFGVSTRCSLKNCDIENLKESFFEEIT